MSDQLSLGQFPLSYLGVGTIPTQPTPLFVSKFVPTSKNTNFQLGTHWLVQNKNIPQNKNLYALVSLTGNNTSTLIAVWVLISTGSTGPLQSLTGNVGGAVFPTAGNINVVGDGVTINIVGNPGTSTLTVSALGAGLVQTLTGDTGGPVPPTAGNINILGTANKITVSGNPGTSTLTLNTGANVATTYNGDTGSAVPAAGVLNVITNNAANSAGSSVKFTGAGSTLTLSVQDGTNSVYIGTNAGNLVATGINNLGLGFNALANVTTANQNTAVGTSSLSALTTGVAGEGHNTALGMQAGTALTAGRNNILLGFGAGINYTTNESSNIVIASQAAGAGGSGVVGESNKIRIGINGTGAGQQNQTILLGGNVTRPNSSAFLATHSAAQNNVTGNNTTVTVNFTTVVFDQNANYDGTNSFTAPVTGRYQFNVAVLSSGLTAGVNQGEVCIVTTSATYCFGDGGWGPVRDLANQYATGGSVLLAMSATDTAHVTLRINGIGADTASIPADSVRTFFSGNLVA